MIKLKKILVPRDASPYAEQAMQYARRLAHLTGAEIHALYVETPDVGSFEKSTLDAAALKMGQTTARTEDDAEDKNIPIKKVMVHDVIVGSGIMSYATREDIDLIVMGTHGRAGFEHVLLGSIAEEVVRLSACPVLIVRSRRKKVHTVNIRSILVPIDFSEHARNALRHAKMLAALLGAKLDLLHVIPEGTALDLYGLLAKRVESELLHAKACEYLKQFYDETDGPLTEATIMVRSGHAAHEILGYAHDRGSHMIVMGTHGLTGIERFFMGSVTEKVVRRAPCPVFTLKSFGKSLMHTGTTSSVQMEADVASEG